MKMVFDFILGFTQALDVSSLMLGFIVLFGTWAAVVAQRKGIVNWADGVRDPDGKVSFMRVAVLVSLITSTWILCNLTIDAVKNRDALDSLLWWYLLYLVIWSGAPTAAKLLEILGTKWGIAPKQP